MQPDPAHLAPVQPALPTPVWSRLSPRMLLVHPVHEVLRQLPLLIGSIVLGSATNNPLWSLLGLAAIIAFGLARWFTTSYRIDGENVALRVGVVQRNVPRCRATASGRCRPMRGRCTACWG